MSSRMSSGPIPYQSSATAKKTPAGDTGVKMTGPYEYVAPSYWLLDTKAGGAHGFNTETSPGPAPPPIESLRRMLPADKFWPIECRRGTITRAAASSRTYTSSPRRSISVTAPSKSAEEYARKAQVMAYEGHRAMFEAFGRNKYTSTGVIQWMLNNAWPGMIWHLYDWYLRPGGSYFGAKKACEPLHVQYSYDDRSIVVVNSYYQPFANMKVAATAYNLDMSVKFSREAKMDSGPDSSTRVFNVPEIAGLSGTWFLQLKLENPQGKTVSENFYWFSTTEETLQWDKGTWYTTPTRSFADYTALETLPPVALKVASKSAEGSTTVTVTNPSRSLAFAVHLKVKRGADGEEVLPVLLEDNYFSLLPGETRQVTATYGSLGNARAAVEVDGWNVK